MSVEFSANFSSVGSQNCTFSLLDHFPWAFKSRAGEIKLKGRVRYGKSKCKVDFSAVVPTFGGERAIWEWKGGRHNQQFILFVDPDNRFQCTFLAYRNGAPMYPSVSKRDGLHRRCTAVNISLEQVAQDQIPYLLNEVSLIE